MKLIDITLCVYVADCECDLNGSDPSFNGSCNSTGYCNCKPNVFGKKCDQCEVRTIFWKMVVFTY